MYILLSLFVYIGKYIHINMCEHMETAVCITCYTKYIRKQFFPESEKNGVSQKWETVDNISAEPL